MMGRNSKSLAPERCRKSKGNLRDVKRGLICLGANFEKPAIWLGLYIGGLAIMGATIGFAWNFITAILMRVLS